MFADPDGPEAEEELAQIDGVEARVPRLPALRDDVAVGQRVTLYRKLTHERRSDAEGADLSHVLIRWGFSRPDRKKDEGHSPRGGRLRAAFFREDRDDAGRVGVA